MGEEEETQFQKMIKVTALRLQNIFFSLPQCKMTLKAFLPKLCAYFRNGRGPWSPGRPPQARPGSDAKSRLNTSATPADSACRLQPPPARRAATNRARIRKWSLCRLAAHLSPPGPCPEVRFQVGRAHWLQYSRSAPAPQPER